MTKSRWPFDLDFLVLSLPYAAAMVTPSAEELLQDAWDLWCKFEDPFRVEWALPPAVVSVEATSP